MRRLIALAAITALLPLGAQAYTATNRLKVAPISDSVFEVVARGGTGARDFWCAAGDYALKQGARSNARIYLAGGRQPSVSEPGRTATRFTLSPDAAGITPIAPQLVLTVDVVGDNISVASAREYCAVDISRG